MNTTFLHTRGNIKPRH